MSMDRKQKKCLCVLRGKYMDLHTPEGDRMAAAITKELLEDEKSKGNHKTRKNEYEMEVTDREGNVTVYPSALEAAIEVGIPLSNLYARANDQKEITKGPARGYRFRKVNVTNSQKQRGIVMRNRIQTFVRENGDTTRKEIIAHCGKEASNQITNLVNQGGLVRIKAGLYRWQEIKAEVF